MRKDESVVLLGYPSAALDLFEVQRANVPSKIGGKPCWLHPRELPKELDCKKCGASLVFLLQLYAPIRHASSPQTFHRMLYIFACWICGRDVRAFRCQISQDLSNLLGQEFESVIQEQCCSFCLLPISEKKKAKLHDFHQRCLNSLEDERQRTSVALGTIKEAILEIHSEDSGDDSPPGDEDEEEACLHSCIPHNLPVIEEEDSEEEDLENEGFLVSKLADPALEQYIDYLQMYPDHVIRYGADRPLWFSSREQLDEANVPNCSLCGSRRKFEFQVQSTLLDFAGYQAMTNLELAFGVLCVYTCVSNCATSDGTYMEEFVFKQNDNTLEPVHEKNY